MFTGSGKRLPLESLNSAAVGVRNGENRRRTDLLIKVGLKVTSKKMMMPVILKVPGMSFRSQPTIFGKLAGPHFDSCHDRPASV